MVLRGTLPPRSFSPLSVEMSAERDVRMVLCACVISELLGDWSGVDVGRASAFVEASQVRFLPQGAASGEDCC